MILWIPIEITDSCVSLRCLAETDNLCTALRFPTDDSAVAGEVLAGDGDRHETGTCGVCPSDSLPSKSVRGPRLHSIAECQCYPRTLNARTWN